jgi:hypothetical protein
MRPTFQHHADIGDLSGGILQIAIGVGVQVFTALANGKFCVRHICQNPPLLTLFLTMADRRA